MMHARSLAAQRLVVKCTPPAALLAKEEGGEVTVGS